MRLKMKDLFNFQNAVFLLLAVSLVSITYSILNYNSGSLNEANIVAQKLTDGNHDISILNYNEVDEQKVKALHDMDYDEVKSMIGVEKDFCVYFEDENGNLIRICLLYTSPSPRD